MPICADPLRASQGVQTTGDPTKENQVAFDHDKGQKSAISGNFLHWIFEVPPVDFPLSPRSSVQFSKEIAAKCGEDSPISVRRMRRILSRLWLSWFFGPEVRRGKWHKAEKSALWTTTGVDENFQRVCQPLSRAPRCGSGSNCLWIPPLPLEDPPLKPQQPFPHPPLPPLPRTHPPWLFSQCSGRGRPRLLWGRGRRAQGGGALQTALGATPTSGGTRHWSMEKSVWTNPLVPCFHGKSVGTNGLVKVSPETGIGPSFQWRNL